VQQKIDMTDRSDQSAEEALAEKLVEVACTLNRRCGMRASHSHNGPQEYSGFSVRLEGLRSAIYAPLQVFFGQAAYDSPFDRAAALIVNIAQGHHFGDGNKRTALHLGLLYLSMLGIKVDRPSDEAAADWMQELVTAKIPRETTIINAGRKLRQWSSPTAAP